MILCVSKEQNSSGQYVRYNLVSTKTGATRSYLAQELKEILHDKPNFVANLSYTRDGKIRDDLGNAPNIIASVPFFERKLNPNILSLAKDGVYVQVTTQSYEDEQSTCEYLKNKFGKEVNSTKVEEELLTEMYYYMLANGAYMDFGYSVGHNFRRDPYMIKEAYGDDAKLRKAVENLVYFGSKCGLQNNAFADLIVFLSK